MSDTRLANGSFPMKIGQQEYAACMLTDRDYADLSGYIQYKYIEVAQNIRREPANEDGDEILRFALSTAVGINWNTREGMEIINTPEGILRLGWQMIRKRHHNLEFKKFQEIPKEDLAAAIDNIHMTYKHLHTLSADLENAPSGAEKS